MTIARMVMISAAAMMISSAAFAVELTNDGKVLKINDGSKMVTIEHGPPVGTTGSAANKTYVYDYKVQDATAFSSLKVGDKIRFVVDDKGTSGKEWTVTKIQKQ